MALGIFFIFGTKFSWNEDIDTCFNVECVLLGRNFDSLGGYCSLPSGYSSLPSGYSSLLVVTARYCSLLLVSTFSMNALPIVTLAYKQTQVSHYRALWTLCTHTGLWKKSETDNVRIWHQRPLKTSEAIEIGV